MSYCRNCGKEISPQAVVCTDCGVPAPKGDKYCQNCGKPTDPIAEFCPSCGVRLSQAQVQMATGAGVSPKSRLVVTLLSSLPACILGVCGIHRFYLGKIWTGIAMLLTLGGLGVWALIDFIFAVSGKMKDKEGRPITRW